MILQDEDLVYLLYTRCAPHSRLLMHSCLFANMPQCTSVCAQCPPVRHQCAAQCAPHSAPVCAPVWPRDEPACDPSMPLRCAPVRTSVRRSRHHTHPPFFYGAKAGTSYGSNSMAVKSRTMSSHAQCLAHSNCSSAPQPEAGLSSKCVMQCPKCHAAVS